MEEVKMIVGRLSIGIASGLAIIMFWATPTLADDTPSRTEQRVIHSSLSEGSLKTFGKLRLQNLKTGESVRAAVAPPGGGCQYPVSFAGVASYTNGTLTSVTLDYEAQVVCTATGPDQFMAGIVVTALLWKDGINVDDGPTVNCVNCLVSPVSRDFYACGGVACAGGYWASNLHALKAPPGYVWPSAPPGCKGLGNPPYAWIECVTVTDVATVPPTV
jgi:hypothetical protein